MKAILTIDELIVTARLFCTMESRENHVELIGVTNGKKLVRMLNINSSAFSSHGTVLI